MVEALPPASGGVAVLNADDPLVAAMADADAGPGDARSASARRRRALRGRDARRRSAARPSTWSSATSGARCRCGLIGEHHAGERRRRGRRGPGARRAPRRAWSPRCAVGDRHLARGGWSVARARRRRHGHQRRLQRQPRLDAGRAQGAGRDRPRPAAARAPSPCSARCSSWASRAARSTTRSADWPCASTSISSRGRRGGAADAPGRLPRRVLGRGVGLRAGHRRRARAGCASTSRPGDVVLFKASKAAQRAAASPGCRRPARRTPTE